MTAEQSSLLPTIALAIGLVLLAVHLYREYKKRKRIERAYAYMVTHSFGFVVYKLGCCNVSRIEVQSLRVGSGQITKYPVNIHTTLMQLPLNAVAKIDLGNSVKMVLGFNHEATNKPIEVETIIELDGARLPHTRATYKATIVDGI